MLVLALAGGCSVATAAVPAHGDGWYESAAHPDWWARWENGRVVEWERKGVVRPPPVPEVDRDAVLRRGNLAEHIDGSIRNSPKQLWSQISGPPESDAGKWVISTFTKQRCPACADLKAQWSNDESLRAFAKPEPASQKESWAHFNAYDADDASQQWRWKDLSITGHPTVIVSPPRNKQYGDPRTVVFQQTYGKGSSPEQLTKDMRAAIAAYLAKLPKQAIEATEAASPVQVKPKTDAPIDQAILPADPNDHKKIPPKGPNVTPSSDGIIAWAKANWFLLAAGGVLLYLFRGKFKAALAAAPVVSVPSIAAAGPPPIRADPLPLPVPAPPSSVDRLVGALEGWDADRRRQQSEHAKVASVMRKLTQLDATGPPRTEVKL